MTLVDVDLCEDEVDSAAFNLVSGTKYPICIAGFHIKNAYDQFRFSLPKKYKPVDIAHTTNWPTKKVLYFRGIQIDLSQKISTFLNKVEEGIFYNFGNLTWPAYLAQLSKHNISCDVNDVLMPNVYPIDIKHLTQLSETDIISASSLYKEINNTSTVPYFQAIGKLNIYILSNTTFFKNRI